MRVAISRALPFLLGFVALSACGGTSQNALPATVIRGGASWMRPEAAGDLLYIADQNKNEVDVTPTLRVSLQASSPVSTG